ncbi:MAG TPA: hypothetical protein VJH23_04165 [archaeon]|nr:hypothetical protein [archaeon]
MFYLKQPLRRFGKLRVCKTIVRGLGLQAGFLKENIIRLLITIYLAFMIPRGQNTPRSAAAYNLESRRLSRKKPVQRIMQRLKSKRPFVIGLGKNQSPALSRVMAKQRAFLRWLSTLERASVSRPLDKRKRILKQARQLDNEYFNATGFWRTENFARASKVLSKLPVARK